MKANWQGGFVPERKQEQEFSGDLFGLAEKVITHDTTQPKKYQVMYQFTLSFFEVTDTLEFFTSQEFFQDMYSNKINVQWESKGQLELKTQLQSFPNEFKPRFGNSSVMEILCFEFDLKRPKNERFLDLSVLANSLSWDLS